MLIFKLFSARIQQDKSWIKFLLFLYVSIAHSVKDIHILDIGLLTSECLICCFHQSGIETLIANVT